MTWEGKDTEESKLVAILVKLCTCISLAFTTQLQPFL